MKKQLVAFVALSFGALSSLWAHEPPHPIAKTSAGLASPLHEFSEDGRILSGIRTFKEDLPMEINRTHAAFGPSDVTRTPPKQVVKNFLQRALESGKITQDQYKSTATALKELAQSQKKDETSAPSERTANEPSLYKQVNAILDKVGLHLPLVFPPRESGSAQNPTNSPLR